MPYVERVKQLLGVDMARLFDLNSPFSQLARFGLAATSWIGHAMQGRDSAQKTPGEVKAALGILLGEYPLGAGASELLGAPNVITVEKFRGFDFKNTRYSNV